MECQTWGSVTEIGAAKLASIEVNTPTHQALPISEVDLSSANRTLTTITELDRVLGGGIVPGAVILLAGEPGVGKSTLLLEVAARWARNDQRTLYISGEESAAQVRLRAERTSAIADELYLASETDLGTVLGHIEQIQPSLLIVDSVQTIGTDQAEGSPGGISQVREVTAALVRVAKREQMAVIIVGHVTKDGAIAGPRLLEHLVDVVLTFEGERHSGFRMVRAVKNRFGPADEVGCFEMGESGIHEVIDPSGIFTSGCTKPPNGTCVTVTMEGSRPLVAEVQSLITPSPNQVPSKRVTHGVSSSRLSMILAVLQRHGRLRLSTKDVYCSTVGGARIEDPCADLAIALAVVSASTNVNFHKRIIALGEIGLAGDLRRVPGAERRIAEAARLGFELAIVPSGNRNPHTPLPRLHGLKVVEASHINEVIESLGLARPHSQSDDN